MRHGCTLFRAASEVSAFTSVAHWASVETGRARTFALAVLVIIVWGVTGPLFGFSDTWQLVINTGTTIITFLMVFLLQNTQSRDTAAIQLKLDELIASSSAHNKMIGLEDMSEDQLRQIKEKFIKLSANEP